MEAVGENFKSDSNVFDPLAVHDFSSLSVGRPPSFLFSRKKLFSISRQPCATDKKQRKN